MGKRHCHDGVGFPHDNAHPEGMRSSMIRPVAVVTFMVRDLACVLFRVVSLMPLRPELVATGVAQTS